MTLIFGYNLVRMKIGLPLANVDYAEHIRDENTGRSYLLVDLADFNADLSFKGVQNWYGLSSRMLNMGRAIEHEFGHKLGNADIPKTQKERYAANQDPGESEAVVVNPIHDELKLVNRVSYFLENGALYFGTKVLEDIGGSAPEGSEVIKYYIRQYKIVIKIPTLDIGRLILIGDSGPKHD